MRRGGWIPDDGNAREARHRLLEDLQALGACLTHDDGHAGEVAAWPGKTGHMAAANRVRVAREDDGNRRGCAFRRPRIDGGRRHDDIDLELNELLRQVIEAIEPPLGPPVFDGDIPALDPTQITQPPAEAFEGMRPHGRTVPQETDAVDLPCLLGGDDARPAEEAAGHGRQDGSARDHRVIGQRPAAASPRRIRHVLTP
jgi:hypothetical protein